MPTPAAVTHELLAWLARPGRRLAYSAYDGDGQVRDGAGVAELTGLLDLPSWPEGMRVIAGKERAASRRAAGVHRHRRPPVHLLRHQHTGPAVG